MSKTEFLKIIDKYLNGISTPEEDMLLERYYESFQSGQLWNEAELGKKDDEGTLLLSRLKEAMVQKKQQTGTIRNIKRYFLWAAASVILMVGFSYLFLFNPNKKEPVITAGAVKSQSQADVSPGGNKAILTLGDGSIIDLDSAGNGRLSQQGNASVLKINAGEISYNNGKNNQGKIVYNTITTPKGGQYQVTLSDGTKVWLNAASSLRFPTSFAEKQREVEITGEAYFEVAKDKERPFHVKADIGEVEVLGTHFNVNAYDEEAEMKTTLLEGSVKITAGGKSGLLKPGQQAVVPRTNSNVYVKNDIDMDEVVAWKNGRFDFNNTDVTSVMREIARWYDVEVVYEGPTPTDHFTGKMTRNTNASNVLKILSLSDEHFRIEGRKIIVTSNKK
ncbi:MAG: FecR domain-containing protein [Bacteroidetes bacterium]|nr:FecR domain-containing protein [Bacteroidota bacterium]MBS1933600.1 FecR domain-containing protein [Bacteroidota bacterium]